MGLSSWLKGTKQRAVVSGFFWNAASGFINAFQSTIILFFIQRIANEDVSGIFSIAYALAGLMSIIGKFNVRYFQVSDLNQQFSFDEYYSHRLITSVLMLSVSLCFSVVQIITGNYSLYKFFVCFLFCCLRAVDCIEDVFGGNYQRNGRLDMAGKAMFLRSLLTTASFVIVFALFKELLVSILVSTFISVGVLAISIRILSSDYQLPHVSKSIPRIKELFYHCLPLFISAFLLQFVITSPKLVIDALLTSKMQATYGFISMPVFLVALLAEFLFRPMTVKFTNDWNQHQQRLFIKRIISVIGMIIGITLGVVIGGYIIGIPLLELFFKTKLGDYKLSFVLLLFGSGVLSLTAFLGMILTIMRKQKLIVYMYLPSSVLAIPVGYYLVIHYSLLGAAISYLLLLSVMFLLMATVIIRFIHIEMS